MLLLVMNVINPCLMQFLMAATGGVDDTMGGAMVVSGRNNGGHNELATWAGWT